MPPSIRPEPPISADFMIVGEGHADSSFFENLCTVRNGLKAALLGEANRYHEAVLERDTALSEWKTLRSEIEKTGGWRDMNAKSERQLAELQAENALLWVKITDADLENASLKAEVDSLREENKWLVEQRVIETCGLLCPCAGWVMSGMKRSFVLILVLASMGCRKKAAPTIEFHCVSGYSVTADGIAHSEPICGRTREEMMEKLRQMAKDRKGSNQ